MEAKHLSITHGKASDDEMDPKGLCNAIIVARPQSIFVKRWLDSYEEFDNRQWADHSVVSLLPCDTNRALLILLSMPPADTVGSRSAVPNNRDGSLRKGILLAHVESGPHRRCICEKHL